MQNPSTGLLEMLSELNAEKIKQASETGGETGVTFSDGKPVPADVPLFEVGQIVEVNGGKFRIRKITKKDLILRSIKR